MIICLCLLFAGRASAQWVVSDPGNLAQGIINASKNIIHTSKTCLLYTSKINGTMSKEIFVAFATQKGGIGKSTVTALAASYLHNVKGLSLIHI